jgi:hypothetical protein
MKSLLLVLAGGLLGSVLVLFLRGEPSGETVPAVEPEAPAGPGERVDPGPAAAEESAAIRESLDRPPEELIGSRLWAYFEEEFLAGWREVRADQPDPDRFEQGRERFQQSVLSLPRSIGRSLAEQAVRRERVVKALEDGDGLTLIELARSGDWAPDPEDPNFELLDRCVAQRQASGSVDGVRFATDASLKLRDGLVIQFGAGKHTLSPRRLEPPRNEPFPTDITIKGAGLDTTLVVIEEISIRSAVNRLAFQDLTIFTGDNYLFGLSYGAAVLDFERARVVGFDMGAGGSLVFFINQGAMIRARDSEFLGGYGKSPRSGNLWRGAALLARFDHCRFERVDLRLGSLGGGQAVFWGCTFAAMLEDPMRWTSSGLRFDGCVTEPLIDLESYRCARKPLTELSPWFE